MKRIEAVIRPERLGEVASNLEARGLAGFTISDVRGHGTSPERTGEYRGNSYEMLVTHKLLITLFVDDEEVQPAVEAISAGAATGRVGDGLVSISDVAAVYRLGAPIPDEPATSAAPPTSPASPT